MFSLLFHTEQNIRLFRNEFHAELWLPLQQKEKNLKYIKQKTKQKPKA